MNWLMSQGRSLIIRKIDFDGLAHSGSCCTGCRADYDAVVPQGFLSSWAQYTIRLPTGTAGRFASALKEKAFRACVIIRSHALADRLQRLDYPMDLVLDGPFVPDGLSLPMHPYLTKEDPIRLLRPRGLFA